MVIHYVQEGSAVKLAVFVMEIKGVLQKDFTVVLTKHYRQENR